MNALYRSLLTEENPFNSTEEIVEWMARRNREVIEERTGSRAFSNANIVGGYRDSTKSSLFTKILSSLKKKFREH